MKTKNHDQVVYLDRESFWLGYALTWPRPIQMTSPLVCPARCLGACPILIACPSGLNSDSDL